jgi:hypothetical protein
MSFDFSISSAHLRPVALDRFIKKYRTPVELSNELINFDRVVLLITGATAVEFIINHAEVSIAFVQENKIPAVGFHESITHKFKTFLNWLNFVIFGSETVENFIQQGFYFFLILNFTKGAILEGK